MYGEPRTITHNEETDQVPGPPGEPQDRDCRTLYPWPGSATRVHCLWTPNRAHWNRCAQSA